MSSILRVLPVLAAIALAAGLRAEEPPPSDAPPAPKIYACQDADGNTVYQDDPCVEPKPAAKKPGEPAPKAPAKTKAATKAKPAPKPAPAAVKPSAASPPPAKKPLYVVKSRAAVLPSLTLPPPPAGRVDPRWATPETTLRTFIEAVNAGDRALVLSCLTSSALSDLGPSPEALPLEGLRDTVSSFTGYVTEGDLGPFWSIRALRQGERPKWIFFERTGLGEWKIVGI